MVKIRLKRLGAKKAPVYRIVVMEAKNRRDGRTIDEIGFYDPHMQENGLKVNVEAAKKWLGNGAQPTDTAKSLLKKANVYSESK
ncbi:MAG: 30S ribosomal protein S16 [Candidatus Sericytochromatia bacterium]